MLILDGGRAVMRSAGGLQVSGSNPASRQGAGGTAQSLLLTWPSFKSL